MNKIEDQELDKIKSFEQKIISVKQELGNIEINKDLLKNAFTTVMQEYDNLRKELEEKYGKVNINISDGSYEEIEKNEETQVKLDLKTIGLILAGAISLAGLYFTLTAEIELAKELPKPELTRTEYDLKDQLIRETIENTAEQVQENSEKLDRIDEKLYEIIQK